jgi:hypothetical protein
MVGRGCMNKLEKCGEVLGAAADKENFVLHDKACPIPRISL